MGSMDCWILVFWYPCLTGLPLRWPSLWEWDVLETTGFALSSGVKSSTTQKLLLLAISGAKNKMLTFKSRPSCSTSKHDETEGR